MEFSYRISEDDYVRGCRMAMKAKRPSVFKTILFWAFIVICLVLLFSVVSKSNHVAPASDSQYVAQDDAQTDVPAPQISTRNAFTNVAAQVGPFVFILAIWGFLFIYWIPNATRRRYRKDTNSHGILTVALDVESFALKSSLGTKYQSGWNVFTGWFEKDGIVLLGFPNGTFQFINVSGLSEAEREDLRGILATALPKKK
jgi:hypothetical protein